MALFADRAAAGAQLADRLGSWRDTDAVVVGIARGGVVVAAAVSRALALPLTAIAVRKLGVPGHEEVAIGAIAEGVRIVDERARAASGTTREQLGRIEKRERAELARRGLLLGTTTGPSVRGRTVLLVDDGVATGSTANVAGRSLRRAGASHVVLAVPVGPDDWRPDADAADEYVCAYPVADFWAVGAFYDDFTQTSDDEVVRLLRDP